MTEIMMDVVCDYCNGDGYLKVTLDQWNSYLAWSNDPSENKSNSNDDFPQFLKMLYNHISVGINGRVVTMQCVRCQGTKTIRKILTLEDLRGLL